MILPKKDESDEDNSPDQQKVKDDSKRQADTHKKKWSRDPHQRKAEHHANDAYVVDDESCPLGCSARHLLAACPLYQASTVNQRWEIVKKNKRCRKCLRGSHHTDDCKKPDGTSCDSCKKNHHRSLHNQKPPNLNPTAQPFVSQSSSTQVNSHNVQGSDEENNKVFSVSGLCPIQKIKAQDKDGNFVEMLAK